VQGGAAVLKRTDEAAIPTIAELQAGGERAWADFFCSFEPTIRAIASWSRWHFDAHTCEDAVQLIKLGIVRSIGHLKSEPSLQAFVRKISVNRCIDLLRKQLRMQKHLIPIGHFNADGDWEEVDIQAGADFDPVAALQQAERAKILQAALLRLDETEQVCLRQFYVEGLSYREMAERQGVAINTVGSRLSRCLEKLRGLLDAADAAPED
jgi:RNA polymerase sigma factor (sigma-70 family)